MRKILTILFLLIWGSSFGQSYYVSPTGNDGNAGTISSPWATLYHAASVATSGTIYLAAGTYTETQTSILAPTVNLEGADTSATIVRATFSALYQDIVRMQSDAGTNGNQSISKITFDGQNSTSWGIRNWGRSNVLIHDCVIKDFVNAAYVCFGDNAFNTETEPVAYGIGNDFYNNRVTNCGGTQPAYDEGNVWYSGQRKADIYNNIIDQTQRADGLNGYNIKLHNWTDSLNIYNNTLLRKRYPAITNGTGDYAGLPNGPGTHWDFSIEVGDYSNLNIYNNIINGSIDVNRGTKTAGGYALRVVGNVIGPDTLSENFASGIIVEYDIDSAIITGNTFKNMNTVLYFSTRNLTQITGVNFLQNNCTNIGQISYTAFPCVQFDGGGFNNYTVSGLKLWNNYFGGNATHSNYLLSTSNATAINGFEFKNNIAQNFLSGYWISGKGEAINSPVVSYNYIYNNGNSNNPLWVGSGLPPVTPTYSNNTAADPDLDANNQPNVTSPVIDAGTNVGLPFNGLAPDIGYYETGSGGGSGGSSPAYLKRVRKKIIFLN